MKCVKIKRVGLERFQGWKNANLSRYGRRRSRLGRRRFRVRGQLGFPGKHRAVSTQNRPSWKKRESWERSEFFHEEVCPFGKRFNRIVSQRETVCRSEFEDFSESCRGVAKLENKFRDKFGNGDEPIDERGEDGDDDDDDEKQGGGDVEEEKEKEKNGKKSNMKKKKRKDEDGGADEFTVPKDKPSIGDGTKRKTQPSWWEADGSHGSTSAQLFGKKKREEMKNPAMRNTLRILTQRTRDKSQRCHVVQAQTKSSKETKVVDEFHLYNIFVVYTKVSRSLRA